MNMLFILNDPPYGRERCDTEALGLDEAETMEGTRCSTMDELAAATLAVDKVLCSDRDRLDGMRQPPNHSGRLLTAKP